MQLITSETDILDLKRRKGSLKEKQLIDICRLDPDTFINYTMSWNAIRKGPNQWYFPTDLYQFPYGSEAGLTGKTVGMTCPMHRSWQEAITENTHVYIEAPREHAKTQRILGRIIWELGINHDLRIKVVCQNDEKAGELVTAIGQHILLNPRVHQVFPDLRPGEEFTDWSKHKITVDRGYISRDASVEASGILATGVGGRADILFFDDPVDFKNAIQLPAMRDTVKQAYYGVWLNLLPAQFGKVVYTCTPWHLKDLSMDIKQNHVKDYFFCSNPINDQMDPVWPDKWNLKALIDRKTRIGQREFDRGFHLKPLSDEDQLFRPSMFKMCYDFNLEFGKLPGEQQGWSFYTGVDPGSSGKSENPKTAMFTFAEKKGTCVPIEIKASRFGEIDKIRQIKATHERFQSKVVAVENNSYQETLVRLMKEMQINLPIKGLYTGSQKADINLGLPSLELEIENRIWIIPLAGHTYENEETGLIKSDGCPICQWLEECFSYPIGLSDILMAWWIAKEGYRELKGWAGGKLLRMINLAPRRTTGFHSINDNDDEDDD